MRKTSYVLLGWLSLWMLVIVPGHQVGRIQTPGSNPAVNGAALASEIYGPTLESGVPSCCRVTFGQGNQNTRKSPAKRIPIRSSANCAVCQWVGKLDVPFFVPPTVPAELPALEVRLPELISIHILASVDTLRGRDPPESA
ncbi:MAG: hypothetical protein GC164_09045 [Phycisphaera sp.]|nr:hypothetical protein [Phycisphaera sp.]